MAKSCYNGIQHYTKPYLAKRWLDANARENEAQDNALFPNHMSSPEGVRLLSELSNLSRLKQCFRVPTIFLGYYITSKVINKHMQPFRKAADIR
jgi:hypothetical protein